MSASSDNLLSIQDWSRVSVRASGSNGREVWIFDGNKPVMRWATCSMANLAVILAEGMSEALEMGYYHGILAERAKHNVSK